MKCLFRYVCIGLCMGMFFLSCSPGKKRIVIDEVPVRDLSMEKLMLLLPDPISPDLYLLSDDYLLLLPYLSSTIIRVYDIHQGVLQSGRLKSSDSKAQIISDPHLYTSVSFLNPSTTAYSEYEVANGAIYLKRNTNMLIGELTPDDVVRVENDVYVAVGKYKEGLFAVINNENQMMRFFGKHPSDPKRPGYFNKEGYMALSGKNVYYISRYMGYLASFRLKDRKLTLNWEAPVLKEEQPEDRNPVEFKGIVAKEKYIYALYAGNSPTDPEHTDYSLLVVNPKGKPVAHCHLPIKIDHFVIDNQEKYMYAVYETHGECWLVRFLLPDW
ncbi:MAG: hypothetical protein LUG98_16815 [Tannerellaceae bacterium]|nr:hypothetical protein [Tannerellaceae bacterium]